MQNLFKVRQGTRNNTLNNIVYRKDSFNEYKFSVKCDVGAQEKLTTISPGELE